MFLEGKELQEYYDMLEREDLMYLEELYEEEEEEEEDEEDYEDRGDFLEEDEDDDELEDSEEGEDEEEGEETSESDYSDESEDDDEDEEDDDSVVISREMLEELTSNKSNADRERIKWLESQLEALLSKDSKVEPEEPAFDFETAEEQYAELLIEGETKKAAALRSKISREYQRHLENQIKQVKEDALTEATKSADKVSEATKFNSLIESFERKHSFLDPESSDYNEEAVDTVNTFLSGYISAGLSRDEALRKAVSKALPFYKREEVSKLGTVRKKKAAIKSAKASRSQPPKTKSTGLKNVDLEAVDVSKLSEKDFDKLTNKEKRALRGDF